ncbi:rRNA maturation RNase YbeY [Patescibacteria group bacterium]|nr:rRNA maturation RNase YbeY [Patescibacteria group bacterium]
MSRVFVGYEQFGIEGVNEEFIHFVFDVVLSLTTKKGDSEVGVALVTNEQMKKMNHRYRGKDATTNVLSFVNTEIPDLPTEEVDNYLGDIYISYPVLDAEADQLEISHKERFAQLLTHGLLHLVGFDHTNKSDTKEMEDLEDQIVQMAI